MPSTLSPIPANKVNLSTVPDLGLNPASSNGDSVLKRGEAVQGRVHNQVSHRKGRIETETEWHGHEVYGREKLATMLRITTENERKAQERMAKREGRGEAKT
jgi:hypothetical protein